MCLGGCFLCISPVVCGGSLACWGHLRDCICVADSLDVFSSKFILYKSLRAGISWRLSAPGLYSACEPKGGRTRTDSFRCSLPFLSALGPKGGDGFLLSTALFTAVCGKCRQASLAGSGCVPTVRSGDSGFEKCVRFVREGFSRSGRTARGGRRWRSLFRCRLSPRSPCRCLAVAFVSCSVLPLRR